MKNTNNPHWIVIDDSKLDCFIAEKLIKNTGLYSTVKSFPGGPSALEYIQKNLITDVDTRTIILVDMYMPVMNGLAFVKELENLPVKTLHNLKVYVVAFPVTDKADPKYIEISEICALDIVSGTANKPICCTTLRQIAS